MSVLIGAVADDSTGATDLANTLVKSGLKTVQLIGVPAPSDPVPEADAIVVALKSRTNPVQEAIAESLAALNWLKAGGAQQAIFKYCSTFDSTEEGNIGPVAEAMMAALDSDFAIACPAFPAAGRTVYQGHLFVWNELLSDSPMRNHPLTPMNDANLVRFLAKQTQLPVGLVPLQTVMQGANAVATSFAELKSKGIRIAIVDALTDEHLVTIGHASKELKLVTGGSGIATGLGSNFGKHPANRADDLPTISGRAAILSGSCSAATNEQVQVAEGTFPVLRLDPLQLATKPESVREALDWAAAKLDAGPVVIAATDTPDSVKAVQDQLGRMEAGELVERALSTIAKALRDEHGVRRLVVAGGETSGAVVKALEVKALRIGAEIAPGVPCTVTLNDPPLALALKSGNFGGPNFFSEALEAMP